MKALKKSLTHDLTEAIQEWQSAARWNAAAVQSIDIKAESFHKLGEELNRVTGYALDATDTEDSRTYWAQQAEIIRNTIEAGLDAYLTETIEQSKHDQERYTILGREAAEIALDECVKLARILGLEAERPAIVDPWNIGALPFLDGTVESFCQDVTGHAEKVNKKNAKNAARENVPAFVLPCLPLCGHEGPAAQVIAGSLQAACSYKPNGAEVLTPDDFLLFADAEQITKDIPAVSRRVLAGWLNASAYASHQQIELKYTPAALVATVRSEAGKVQSRATFNWITPTTKGIQRAIRLESGRYPVDYSAQPVTVPAYA